MATYWCLCVQKSALREFCEFSSSDLENFEKLEQLRALENNIAICTTIADKPAIGIDTLEDLEEARGISLKLTLIIISITTLLSERLRALPIGFGRNQGNLKYEEIVSKHFEVYFTLPHEARAISNSI